MARIAAQTDYEAAVGTIVAAFDTDPLWSWMFPDPARRAEQHATIFGLYVESALPNQGVWMTDERASAVAVFTHPGNPELSGDAEARLEPFLIETLGGHTPAALTTLERFEAAVPQGRPFYYLSFLGTRPDSRGKGIGMGLLAELVAQADRDGQPTYLESTNPDNNRRYERLGFEAQSRFSTPDDLHTVTTMWREPSVSR
jgi:ribosomal protein S18 acetylase RimI-like enzyme